MKPFNATTPVRAVPNWLPLPPPVDPALAGSVSLSATGPFAAGSLQTITLVYTAGRFGIDDTGAIRICFRFATDQGQPQFNDAAAANYVTVEASNGAILDVRYDYKLNMRPWDRTVSIRVVKGFMREGDTITACFGDRRGGSPGFRLQTFVDPFFELQVLADPIATGHFVRVPNQPTIAIGAGPVATWSALLPTLRPAGETFSLGVRADDRWGNPADADGRTIRLRGEGPLAGLPGEVTFAPGQSSMRIEALSATAPGIIRIVALAADGTVLASSNPLAIVEKTSVISCWADLHAQSAETIGSGSLADYLEFARDQAFLDAIGHQGNDFQITPEFWRDLNAQMADINEPGRFIAVYGYEWSGNTALGGDRNVFFFDRDRPIRRSSHALVPDRADEALDCHDANALFESLNKADENAICWAHCGGRYADIHYAHDMKLERAVEVHSSWGTFEWLLHDALELGHRVGVVANSDGHKGRPGAEPPGASMFGALGGLTCFLVKDLTREALFDAMRARHHYGTTGCRLHLHTEASWKGYASIFRDDPRLPGAVGRNGLTAIMGDIVETDVSGISLEVEVAAQSAILLVEVFNGREKISEHRPYAHQPLGKRVLVTWSGAEYRGRFRQTVWDGKLTVTDNRILTSRPVNFFNPDLPLNPIGDTEIGWRSSTTGNFAGVELILESGDRGSLRVETSPGTLEAPIASLGLAPLTVDCGKLERALRVVRLPDENAAKEVRLDLRVELHGGDNPLFVAITLEDGHRAWSSPIYMVRKS